MTSSNLTFKYIKDLVKFRNEIISKNLGRPEPSWVRITTITMCSKFLEVIDLPKFRESFKEIGTLTIRNKDTHFDGFKWSLKESKFYNQVSIGYKDAYSNKSIKIFPNGSIQVCGCADLFDCQRILNQLSLIMKIILKRDTLMLVGEPSIKMINTNFSLNTSVNILKIITKMSHPPFRVTYDPDRYSAVKIKFSPGPDMKQVTASIFSTGKIIVTGAETLDEIAQAYRILNEKLNDPKIFVKTVTVHETFDNILGGTFEDWNKNIN